MDVEPSMASVGAMIGSPARASMLSVLFDGRSLTATELSHTANVSNATGSEHLAKLVAAKLIVCEQHGRHRYYRLASPDVAHALEPLVHLVAAKPTPMRTPSKSLRRLRHARLCYDHFAGELGVAITSAMTDMKWLVSTGKDFELTNEGKKACTKLGLDLLALQTKRRKFAPQCLDWSERLPHLAGSLGAAIAKKAFDEGWVTHTKVRREVSITNEGIAAFEEKLGVRISQ